MAVEFTREEVERALDEGRLYVKATRGASYKCRRNGRTQTWKTRPDDYRIPFKFGFKDHGALSPAVAYDTYFEIRRDV